MSFDVATSVVAPEQVTESVVSGSDPEAVVESIRRWTDAGYTHIATVQVGDDQAAFMRAWSEDIRPKLP